MAAAVRGERSPGIKLLFVALVGLVLTIPLLMVYALVYDRQSQSTTAQAEINAGWGGAQVIAGPVIVVPFRTTETQTEKVDGKSVEKIVEVERLLYISPVTNRVNTTIKPEERRKSIYRSVLYAADVRGSARFALPDDIGRFGVTRERLLWDRAELRMGTSDARGLTGGGVLEAAGKALPLQPGKGPAATGGQGFFAFLPWDGTGELAVNYRFGLRGSGSLSLVPRGGQTHWDVSSVWAIPSFTGDFLPERRSVTDAGFTASYAIDKLALGQPPVAMEDYGEPANRYSFSEASSAPAVAVRSAVDNAAGGASERIGGTSQSLGVELIEPVNLYAKVNRAVKYGFLFIGFTFLTFLLFDIVGGARVASAEYLLTGAALVLFFVLLLAFAELIGFTPAYVVASLAVIGMLAAYSTAVLKSMQRGGFVGALLMGLYALLFVLLNLEAWSLLIGSVLLFVALAGVMYATRNVDWGNVGKRDVAVGGAGAVAADLPTSAL